MGIWKDISNPGWKEYVIGPCALWKGNQHRSLDQIVEITQAGLCFDCVMSVSPTGGWFTAVLGDSAEVWKSSLLEASPQPRIPASCYAYCYKEGPSSRICFAPFHRHLHLWNPWCQLQPQKLDWKLRLGPQHPPPHSVQKCRLSMAGSFGGLVFFMQSALTLCPF